MTHSLFRGRRPDRWLAGAGRGDDSGSDYLHPTICPSPASPALPPPVVHNQDLDARAPRAPEAIIQVEEIAICPPTASAVLPPHSMMIISTAAPLCGPGAVVQVEEVAFPLSSGLLGTPTLAPQLSLIVGSSVLWEPSLQRWRDRDRRSVAGLYFHREVRSFWWCFLSE